MIKNYFWTFIVRNFDQLFKFLVGIFLARKLLPEDFGVMAITIAIISIINSIVRFGFGSAIIQFKGAKLRNRLSSIFWFNILLAITIFIILNFFANTISVFFDSEILEKIINVISILIIFESLILVQRSYLKKTLKFKLINQRLIISSLISGLLGCYMALNGFGVWSLVAIYFSSSFISLILYWFYSDWRPKLIFSYTDIKPILNFGMYRFLEVFIKDLFKRLNTFFIGKYFSIGDLGFFNKANSFSKTFIINSVNSFNTVLYPHLSKNQDNDNKFFKIYNIIFSVLTLVIFSLSGLFYIWSFEIINFLYGDNWNRSADILKIIIVAAFVRPLISVNTSLFLAKGFSKQSFNISLISRFVSVLTIIYGIYYGFELFLFAYVVSEIIFFFTHYYYIFFKLKTRILLKNINSIYFYLFSIIILILIDNNFDYSLNIKYLISLSFLVLGFIINLIFYPSVFKLLIKIYKQQTI